MAGQKPTDDADFRLPYPEGDPDAKRLLEAHQGNLLQAIDDQTRHGTASVLLVHNITALTAAQVIEFGEKKIDALASNADTLQEAVTTLEACADRLKRDDHAALDADEKLRRKHVPQIIRTALAEGKLEFAFVLIQKYRNELYDTDMASHGNSDGYIALSYAAYEKTLELNQYERAYEILCECVNFWEGTYDGTALKEELHTKALSTGAVDLATRIMQDPKWG